MRWTLPSQQKDLEWQSYLNIPCKGGNKYRQLFISSTNLKATDQIHIFILITSPPFSPLFFPNLSEHFHAVLCSSSYSHMKYDDSLLKLQPSKHDLIDKLCVQEAPSAIWLANFLSNRILINAVTVTLQGPMMDQTGLLTVVFLKLFFDPWLDQWEHEIIFFGLALNSHWEVGLISTHTGGANETHGNTFGVLVFPLRTLAHWELRLCLLQGSPGCLVAPL